MSVWHLVFYKSSAKLYLPSVAFNATSTSSTVRLERVIQFFQLSCSCVCLATDLKAHFIFLAVPNLVRFALKALYWLWNLNAWYKYFDYHMVRTACTPTWSRTIASPILSVLLTMYHIMSSRASFPEYRTLWRAKDKRCISIQTSLSCF